MYSAYIKKAKFLLWNGPLGVFEYKNFSHGTKSIARLIGARSRKHAYAVVGGGETVTALDITQTTQYIDFISTGGGAMIEYLINPNLPGIKALK
jgi:phosphoglycerate kinase